jgi:hypothetical protein
MASLLWAGMDGNNMFVCEGRQQFQCMKLDGNCDAACQQMFIDALVGATGTLASWVAATTTLTEQLMGHQQYLSLHSGRPARGPPSNDLDLLRSDT